MGVLDVRAEARTLLKPASVTFEGYVLRTT